MSASNQFFSHTLKKKKHSTKKSNYFIAHNSNYIQVLFLDTTIMSRSALCIFSISSHEKLKRHVHKG